MAHLEEQEKRGQTWMTVSTKDMRELLTNYRPQSFDYAAIAGMIRQWPFPHGTD